MVRPEIGKKLAGRDRAKILNFNSGWPGLRPKIQFLSLAVTDPDRNFYLYFWSGWGEIAVMRAVPASGLKTSDRPASTLLIISYFISRSYALNTTIYSNNKVAPDHVLISVAKPYSNVWLKHLNKYLWLKK